MYCDRNIFSSSEYLLKCIDCLVHCTYIELYIAASFAKVQVQPLSIHGVKMSNISSSLEILLKILHCNHMIPNCKIQWCNIAKHEMVLSNVHVLYLAHWILYMEWELSTSFVQASLALGM